MINKKEILFFFRILSILTHTYGKRGEDLKKTDSDVYLKGFNSGYPVWA